MNSALVIARKEFRDGLRNKWVAAITLLLAALAFALTFIGSSPTGLLEAKPLAVTVVSISSLTIFLIPLIALLLGYDAIVGEHERGCLLLMLTYRSRASRSSSASSWARRQSSPSRLYWATARPAPQLPQ